MKITYLLRDDGGCGYYRMKLPMGRLHDSGIIVKEITAGMSADAIYDSFDSDLFVIPRPYDEMSYRTIEILKEEGKKIVLDYDDNMFHISPLSVHYKDFGTEEVKIQGSDGEWLDLWIDGKNIDLEKNRKVQEQIKKCLQLADAVTVTQPVLADLYKEYNPNVHCLPNCVDLKVWKQLPFKRRDDIRLYWSGGASHYQDWLILQDVLPVIFDKYKQVKLVIMGTVFHGTIKGLDKSRIEIHPWVHTQAYPYKTATIDADISLIPLEDNEFNRCKSNIKWVEQSAISVPSVTSAVTPYVEHNNGVNGVYVRNETQDWIDGISCMIEEPLLRSKLAGEARSTVEQKFDIDKIKYAWIDTYESILNG